MQIHTSVFKLFGRAGGPWVKILPHQWDLQSGVARPDWAQPKATDVGPTSDPVPTKHIMIGIDGTWQAAYRDPFQSNVHRLNVALNYFDEADELPQLFIYVAGVGTANKSSRLRAGVFGEGLDEIVLTTY